MSSQQILTYVKVQPLRPFRLIMNSGKTFDVRHPEMVRVGRDYLMHFTFVSESPDIVGEWQTISLLLVESIVHLDALIA